VTDSEVSSTKREPIEVADSDEVVDREEEESVDDENKTEKRAESTDDEEVSEESELSENTDVNAGEDSGSESSDEESEELTSEEASANSEENNDEENESLSDLEEESNDNESSSDDSADKKSEELDEESENDSDISEWFTITGNVEDSGVGDTTEVSFTVVNTGGPAEDTIVDLEIFNEEGSQVYQDYKIDQSFENDQDRDYQFTWKPDTAGTYSASVGIFKPSWSSIYSWHDDIASFEIVDNGSSSSEENDDGSESVESNDSDPQDQDDLLNGDSSEISMSESDFYNEEGPADRQYDEWKDDRPEDAELIKKIVDQPIAKWFGGWNNDIKSDVDAYVSKAHKQGKTPVMVAYNIPDRDCGSHSAGGLSSLSEYEQWINDFADGIDGRDSIVILEPDAAALTNCLDDNEREARLIVLGEAAAVLRDHGAKAYIDASHANWLSANDMADRLKSAGIEKASGFALNTSNFVSTEKNLQYGRDISKQTNGAHFVIDTSRNGNGAASDNEWCNPEGRALGQKPTFVDNDPLLDAFIWTKVPGESDGKCNGGPAAGVWWPEYALGLAERADW
ncbi:MAG: glycoside hydrolase family 6 protein, partial [Candidatus Paceibacterota bacterium]